MSLTSLQQKQTVLTRIIDEIQISDKKGSYESNI